MPIQQPPSFSPPCQALRMSAIRGLRGGESSQHPAPTATLVPQLALCLANCNVVLQKSARPNCGTSCSVPAAVKLRQGAPMTLKRPGMFESLTQLPVLVGGTHVRLATRTVVRALKVTTWPGVFTRLGPSWTLRSWLGKALRGG